MNRQGSEILRIGGRSVDAVIEEYAEAGEVVQGLELQRLRTRLRREILIGPTPEPGLELRAVGADRGNAESMTADVERSRVEIVAPAFCATDALLQGGLFLGKLGSTGSDKREE